MDLAKKYLEYLDKDDRGETFDDFFDWIDVPCEQRSDFVIGAILNRAQKLLRRELI
jgi:hypothetical protein